MNHEQSKSTPFGTGPARYRIVLEGSLGSGAANWFEDAEVVFTGAHTEITVVVADQAALHGFLRRIHDLHLKLVAVARVNKPTNRTTD